MTRRRQRYRLRQVCPERFPEKIDIESIIRNNGWTILMDRFQGIRYVRGEDTITCYRNGPKLNGQPISKEEKDRLLTISSSYYE